MVAGIGGKLTIFRVQVLIILASCRYTAQNIAFALPVLCGHCALLQRALRFEIPTHVTLLNAERVPGGGQGVGGEQVRRHAH